MQFIDIQRQHKRYRKEIDTAIKRVLDKGIFILGEEVEELEKELAAFVGVDYAVSVSSGTDSLLMALMAFGVKPGDEVITTPFTFISSSEVIDLLGATPVFVDIDEFDYNLNVAQLEAAITEKTKAIMPVSLFGQMANYKEINLIAHKYGIPVIEDGAQSFGASQNGKMSCSVTTVGSTSFFPAKPLGCCGDGGALFTNDQELYEKFLKIRVHGSESRNYHTCLGINGRLDSLQAAILRTKLSYFSQEIKQRIKIGARYTERLQESVIPPAISEGNEHVYAIYTIRTKHRHHLEKAFDKASLPYGIYYPLPLHLQPVYKYLGYCEGDFPVCEKVSKEVFSLPMHAFLTEEEQDTVIKTVEKALLVGV